MFITRPEIERRWIQSCQVLYHPSTSEWCDVICRALIGSWQLVAASYWLIGQVIMSCWDIKRSSGRNHVLYLISILNCQQAVMNVSLNEVLRCYCSCSAKEMLDILLDGEWYSSNAPGPDGWWMSRRQSWRDTCTRRLSPGTWPGWGPSQGPLKYYSLMALFIEFNLRSATLFSGDSVKKAILDSINMAWTMDKYRDVEDRHNMKRASDD